MNVSKFINKNLLRPILSLSVFITLFANASQCDINFKYGVIIDPAHIRILEHDKTYVQINGTNQLFVNGKEVELSNAQAKLVSEYASGIRLQIPEIVSIAIESVDIGLKAVNKVIASVTGENSASHQKLQERFDELQWRLRKRFNQSDQNFYIAPQDFDDFDEIFAGQFEQEIEAIVTESIGSILAAVGEAVTSNEESNGEGRVNTFGERIAIAGEELELELSPKVNSLESKADLFCQNLKSLDAIEIQLSQQISELSQFDLIKKIN